MHRSRGFTVVEAVVSLALTALFLLIASQLVRDTQIAALSTRRQALDPTPRHLTQTLRNDVHRARRIELSEGEVGGTWSHGALDLAFAEGGGVRYEKSAGAIRRTLVAADGLTSGSRPIMREVLGWRWLRLAPELIELEVSYRRRPDGEALRDSWQDPGSSIDTTRMRLAVRAVPGRSSW